jgi:hypothetical protein
MFTWIVFIIIPILAVAWLCGRFTANYAAERGAPNGPGSCGARCCFRCSPFNGWCWGCCRKSKARLAAAFSISYSGQIRWLEGGSKWPTPPEREPFPKLNIWSC